jgi:hypothetical protein
MDRTVIRVADASNATNWHRTADAFTNRRGKPYTPLLIPGIGRSADRWILLWMIDPERLTRS